MTDVTGVILAGGESRRMGSDKALLELGGLTFLERLRRTLSAVAPGPVVSAADPGSYRGSGLKVIGDLFPRCGPLGGIHAALSAIRTPRALFVPCDMPLVTPGACRRLILAGHSTDVLIAVCGGRPQPLFGVYRKKILPELEAALRQGRYSVLEFLRTVSVGTIDAGSFPGPANVNTPGEYADLLSAREDYLTTAPSPLI